MQDRQLRPVQGTNYRSVDGIFRRTTPVRPPARAAHPVGQELSPAPGVRPLQAVYRPDRSRFIDNVVVNKRPLGRSAAARSVEPVSSPMVSRPVVMDQAQQERRAPDTASVTKSLAKPKRHGLRNFFANVGVIVLAVIVGVSFFDQRVGMILIAVAGLVMLIARLDSRYYFGAAVFALTMIPILSLMNQADMGNNYAVYAFELLALGVVASILEVIRQARHRKSGADSLAG